MYICVKTNENLDELVKTLLEANISIKVNRYERLTWVEADLFKYNYLAFLSISTKALVIHERFTNEDLFRISLDDLETVYDIR